MLLNLALIPLLSVLNRLRGTEDWRKSLGLPGHSRYWITAVLGGILYFLYGTDAAIVWSIVYLLYNMLPWGGLYGLEYYDKENISRFEKYLLELTFDNKLVAFMLRNAISLIPAAILISPWLALILAVVFALSYKAGWLMTPKHGTVTAEFLVGALFGLTVVLVQAFAPVSLSWISQLQF